MFWPLSHTYYKSGNVKNYLWRFWLELPLKLRIFSDLSIFFKYFYGPRPDCISIQEPFPSSVSNQDLDSVWSCNILINYTCCSCHRDKMIFSEEFVVCNTITAKCSTVHTRCGFIQHTFFPPITNMTKKLVLSW